METFKSIIDKISEGLNFFDFSFFVSGFVTYVTLLYFFGEMFCKTIEYTTVTGVLASIVLSYICGIISFSMGKWIRTKIQWLFHWKWLGDWRDRDFDEIFKESQENFIAFSGLCEEFGATLNTPVFYNDAGNVMNFNSFSYSAMWLEIRKLVE